MDHLPHTIRRFLADEPYRQLTPDELWSRFRDHGEDGALRVLLERVGGRIYARCRAVVGDDPTADDAFQETFVELYRWREKLPTYGQAVAWLYVTATNKAQTHKRWWRRLWHRERAKAEATSSEAAAVNNTAVREQAEMVHRALARLPERERRAVELVYLEGMTHEQAAAALGLGRGSVGKYVERGKNLLRQRLERMGAAVVSVAALEVALQRVACAETATTIDVLFDRTWAEAVSTPLSASAGLAGPAMLAVVSTCVGIVALVIALKPEAEPVALSPTFEVAPTPAERESLQDRNARITRDELAPQLREQLQRFYPPPHRVGEPLVRAVGSEVEVEFRVTPPVPAAIGLATRLRGRYCMVLRQLTVYGQPSGETRWYWMNPDKPLALQIPIPLGPKVEVVRGREEFVAAEKLFAKLAPDERAEPDQIRALFGSETAMRLPTEMRGVSGFSGGLVLATQDGGLFVRDAASRWRAAGTCPGWEPVVADGRVYCYTHGMIQSRPLNNPNAPWEKWCDDPPLAPGERGLRRLFVAAGRLCVTADPGGLYSRPLTDRQGGWKRNDYTLNPNYLAVVGETLFGSDGKQLFKRPAARLDATWVPTGPWPGGDDRLIADGDRLLVYTWGPGPIYGRPASAVPDVLWQEVGRVHDPYQH